MQGTYSQHAVKSSDVLYAQLYVGNLRSSVDERDLQDSFGKFGTSVVSLELKLCFPFLAHILAALIVDLLLGWHSIKCNPLIASPAQETSRPSGSLESEHTQLSWSFDLSAVLQASRSSHTTIQEMQMTRRKT